MVGNSLYWILFHPHDYWRLSQTSKTHQEKLQVTIWTPAYIAKHKQTIAWEKNHTQNTKHTSSVILGVQIKVSETQYHVHQCMFNIDTNKKLAMCDMWLWYLLMTPNSFCHLRKMGTVASTVQIRRPYPSANSTKVVSWCLIHACRKVTCEVWAHEFAHLKKQGDGQFMNHIYVCIPFFQFSTFHSHVQVF